MSRVRDAIVEAAVTVDIVDVGGGFPSVYPGMEPPPLETYFAVIHAGFEALPISYSAELWCEPGRALCAEYGSLVVRVEKRRGDELYINDGAYGALFDAAHIGWRYPVQLVRERRPDARRCSSASTARPATISTTWPGRSSFRPTSGRRLYRDRHARRLWLRDAHAVQRLRRRPSREIVDDEPMASLYGDGEREPLERGEAVAVVTSRRRGRAVAGMQAVPRNEPTCLRLPALPRNGA